MRTITINVADNATPAQIIIALGMALAAPAAAEGKVAPIDPKPLPETGPTVTLHATGHVLPMPSGDETFWGYFARTCPFTGGNVDTLGAGMTGGFYATLPSQTGNRDHDWPINADAFANPEKYGIGSDHAAENAALAAAQAVLQPGAQDVRTFDVPTLEWVITNIEACLQNGGATHGPVSALHELSQLKSAAGITDAGNGCIVPPPSFPQLATMTVQRAKQLAGLA